MKIIYKKRASGKTTEIVKLSAKTQIPIICASYATVIRAKEIAQDLGLVIPEPIAIKDYKPHSIDKILVDDAEDVLKKLLGNIEAITISDLSYLLPSIS